MCRKFEGREDIHYKTQTGTSCENSKAFRLGIEPASSGLLDKCSTTELQKPLPTTLNFLNITMTFIYSSNDCIAFSSVKYTEVYKGI